MGIRLVRPAAAHEAQARAFRQAFFDRGETVINGSELLDQTDDYDTWLQSVTANTNPETVNPNWVVTDTFFAVDDADRIVGIIDLRHTLNDFLRDSATADTASARQRAERAMRPKCSGCFCRSLRTQV